MQLNNIRSGIKGKLLLFGACLLLVFLASATFTYIKVAQISKLSDRIANVRSLSLAEGSKLKIGIISSANNLRGYIITKDPAFVDSWGKVWSNDINPALENLKILRKFWTSDKNTERLDSILLIIPQFKEVQTKAVEAIKNNFPVYSETQADPAQGTTTVNIFSPVTHSVTANSTNEKEILALFTKEIAPRFRLLNQLSGSLSQSQLELLMADTNSSTGILSEINTVNITLSLIGAGLIFILIRLLLLSNTRYLNTVKLSLLNIAQGKINREDALASEVEMAELAGPIHALSEGIKKTSRFAMEIGKGNLNAEFTPLSEDDTLGISLLNMRENLRNLNEEEKKRTWINEGLAKFGDILREQNKSEKELCDSIISNLVKYMDANQGALYTVCEDEFRKEHLELAACYAWNRKKYLNVNIEKGEGLIGQTWQEGEKIYLTDVPDNFIKITSGLGDANPRCIYITPLKINDRIYGVMEIASFKVLEKFETEFIEKLSESIASVLSTTKINDRTKQLLEQSQSQTEELRAQEEEMRQGMEEMRATQEEMQRILQKSDMQKKGFEQTLNHALNGIITLNSKKEITFINATAERLLGYTISELAGKNIRFVLPAMYSHASDATTETELIHSQANTANLHKEHELSTKSGSTFWANIALVKLNAEIEDQSYILFIRDITEDKQNLDKIKNLQELQAEFNTRLKLIDIACIVSETDLKGVITYVNDKFCETSKYTRQELIGKPHNIVRHPDMPATVFKQMWATISHGEIFRADIKNRAKDGSAYWGDALIAPVLDSEGKPVKYISIRYDTEDKKTVDEQPSTEEAGIKFN